MTGAGLPPAGVRVRCACSICRRWPVGDRHTGTVLASPPPGSSPTWAWVQWDRVQWDRAAFGAGAQAPEDLGLLP